MYDENKVLVLILYMIYFHAILHTRFNTALIGRCLTVVNHIFIWGSAAELLSR